MVVVVVVVWGGERRGGGGVVLIDHRSLAWREKKKGFFPTHLIQPEDVRNLGAIQMREVVEFGAACRSGRRSGGEEE